MTTALEMLAAFGFASAVLAALIAAGLLLIGLAVLLWNGWLWIWDHVTDPPRAGIERWAKKWGTVLALALFVAYVIGMFTLLGGMLIEDIGWRDFRWIEND